MAAPDSVDDEIDKLNVLFQDLVDRTLSKIMERKISVKEFKFRLFNLTDKHKILHREFVKFMLSKMHAACLEDIFSHLCLYWNFLNYTFLERLVKCFGDTSLNADFSDFKRCLKSFRSRTRLKDYAVYLRKLNPSLSRKKLKKFVVKFNTSWEECTLEDVERSKLNMTEKFFIPASFFSLIDAESSSVKITWAVPSMIVRSLKESFDRADIKEFSKQERILSMYVDVGDDEKQFTALKMSSIQNISGT